MSRALSIALLLAAGCASKTSGSAQTGGANSAASGSSGTGGSGAVTGASSTATGGTSGSSTGSSATGGSSSGGNLSSPFADGGYVFCENSGASSGGSTSWMCRPGTYFCDLRDQPGKCFQCRSDADCASQALPTYDPARARCDLDSGVPGYQNFCQECLVTADCSGNPAGGVCDLSLSFAEPSIEALGFETCEPQAAVCSPGSYLLEGVCVSSSEALCSSDRDCVGVVSQSQLPEPNCWRGACSFCDADFCPGSICENDGVCGDAGLVCDEATNRCLCTDGSQCGENWPVCEGLDGGSTNDAGQPTGTCGCNQDDQCGDAGLRCLGLPGVEPVCGLACTDSRLPSCVLLNASTPICNADSGYCAPCDSDGDCQDLGSQLTGFFCRLDGQCGCKSSADCPRGTACQGPLVDSLAWGLLGACLPQPRCTPVSCGNELCDWDGGACWTPNPLESPNVLECLTDYDCSYSPLAAGPLCDSDGGVCVQCLADPDCLASGLASQGLSHCDPLQHLCTAGCGDNADCVGSPVGSVCIDGGVYPDLVNFCGCGADPDCAGNPSGPHCDIDSSDSLYGLCTCLSSSECSGGEACQLSANSTSAHCSGSCSADADCPANYFCDSTSTCRPRCDTGHGCHGADPVCDSHDIVGLNGKGLSGAVPGAIWCYPCLNGTDCSGNLGCGADTKYSCGSCGLNADCAPGEVCLGDGLCHATCDAGSCPEGELCDTQGTAGNGLDVCYQCISPADCSGGQGCDTLTHGCGTCRGPNADGGPFDCPPDAICSNYWSSSVAGVCLQDCDVQSCPAGELCAVLPALTPDHKYCFGCLQDSDCADGGPGAWCDVSVHLTFACQPGALP